MIFGPNGSTNARVQIIEVPKYQIAVGVLVFQLVKVIAYTFKDPPLIIVLYAFVDHVNVKWPGLKLRPFVHYQVVFHDGDTLVVGNCHIGGCGAKSC
jgi:hypothetical protein